MSRGQGWRSSLKDPGALRRLATRPGDRPGGEEGSEESHPSVARSASASGKWEGERCRKHLDLMGLKQGPGMDEAALSGRGGCGSCARGPAVCAGFWMAERPSCLSATTRWEAFLTLNLWPPTAERVERFVTTLRATSSLRCWTSSQAKGAPYSSCTAPRDAQRKSHRRLEKSKCDATYSPPESPVGGTGNYKMGVPLFE